MKPRFDKLFQAFTSIGTTPGSLSERLEASGARRMADSNRLGDTLTAFRHLRRDQRLKAVQDFLCRHPAPPSWEAKEARAKEKNPLLYPLSSDINGPSSCFYDVAPGEWHTSLDEQQRVVWALRSPLTRRAHIAPFLPSMEAVYGALVRLAIERKMAFQVSLASVAACHARYGHVFMPVGDRRAANLASRPAQAHEVRGLPSGIALLFPRETDQWFGRLIEYPDGKTSKYGLSIVGQFYAIQFETEGFHREPHFPASIPV